MAAGDPGSPARYYSSTAVETALGSSIPAQSQGQANTSFIVGSISGFPTDYPYTLIVDPDTSKEEVVTVYAGSGTTLSVYRGADNTQAVAHSAGAVVRHGVSGRDFRESENHIAARGYDIDQTILIAANQTHVHGIATGDGVIVGTLKSQTLTQKTLTTPIINGATITGTVTATSATFTNPTISGSPVITGLSSAGMVDSSATPKIYVDSILGSATSAAISAASAAVSATSAATSATSAAASASASASSASAAATSATSALTSQTAAATSATSAAASATAAATSATSAAASATASASSASAAATSATSAAASATAAATSATSAAASATAAASSAGTAATSAGQAATSATSAATSATSAAASASAAATSATSASASATAAATSASSASTSASSALTSQTAAATSAASASTSASSALTSATSAATSYDEFDDRYLGAKATPPSVDNDGNALITGALYWNTAVNKMYVWSGTAWGEISSSADIISYKYTVAGGATSVSGVDDNGLTLTYTVGKEQVYINGVLQVRGSDYTATTGSSITGITAMLASDIVTVLAFTAFSVSNTYTQAEADAKFYQTAVTNMAGKNAIINGAMEIDQRNTATTANSTTAGVSSTVFGPDRARLFSNNAGVFSIQQVEDAPAGFRYSCKITTTTADASVTGADRANFAQFVENVNWNRFAWGTASAKPVTVSFWVKSSLTGTFFFAINVSGGGAAYYTTYTISAANTWEYKTITIPGPTAAATWATASTDVLFGGLCAGPDRQTSTLNSWTTDTTIALGTSSTVNLVSTLNATWQITGWQIEQGSVATAFSRAGGTIAGELAACQRYYQRLNSVTAYGAIGGIARVTNTGSNGVAAWFPAIVRMRVAPTALDTGGAWQLYGTGAFSLTSIILNSENPTTLSFLATSSAATANTLQTIIAENNAASYLGWSAEL